MKRLKIGLAAGGFGLLIVFLGGWWFTFSVAVIVHLALLEFFRMAEFVGIRPATKTTLLACHLILITTQLGLEGVLPNELIDAVLPLSGAAICGWLILQPVTGSIADIAASVFGLFYLGFLPSHWLKLRNINLEFHSISVNWNHYGFELLTPGLIITLMACLMIVASDIGSYSVGRKFGRNPLSPVSPGKTIEGALGGLFSAIVLGLIFGGFLQLNYGFIIGALIGALVGLFALVGDLTESMLKRNAGLKDSGDALPGHGGILDRIDSYLFTPAIVYYLFIFLLPVSG